MTSDELAGDDAGPHRRRRGSRQHLVPVEAGAGSGKTSCLVDRFVALVESGVAADRIAAITFTEKAAAELVDRIRSELQQRARDSATCRDALRVLDSAAIGTLHSFAQRILSEHPVEAGLPPRFSVNDEIASQVAFDTRWEQFADEMLDEPGPGGAAAASVRERRQAQAPARRGGRVQRQLGSRRRAHRAHPRSVDSTRRRVRDSLPRLRTSSRSPDHCTDETDRLFRHLTGPVAEFEELLRSGPTLTTTGCESSARPS